MWTLGKRGGSMKSRAFVRIGGKIRVGESYTNGELSIWRLSHNFSREGRGTDCDCQSEVSYVSKSFKTENRLQLSLGDAVFGIDQEVHPE
jgi:hypothetical protein